jgi:hypothetical protein
LFLLLKWLDCLILGSQKTSWNICSLLAELFLNENTDCMFSISMKIVLNHVHFLLILLFSYHTEI